MKTILVAGAGGFIGGHLVRRLTAKQEFTIIAVDIKPLGEWFQVTDPSSTNRYLTQLDLKKQSTVELLFKMFKFDEVYNLAADMGGMGFIESHKTDCMLSVLINTNLLLECKPGTRYFYASSACVYNATKQSSNVGSALREGDAYPAMPEDGYGWEKLFSERMCRHFLEDRGIQTRVARFHNVYGPNGSWQGGREKAPAAICRKVLEAVEGKTTCGEPSRSIEIWGDGEQTRSFMYIDDCLHGIDLIMHSVYPQPVNLGSSELVSINELVTLAESFADCKLNRKYKLDAPQGVRGRNSDNSLIQSLYGWQPSYPLVEGLRHTYAWVKSQRALQSP